MDFSLSEEDREIRAWVRTFVQKELIPLEQEVLSRERAGRPTFAPASTRRCGPP